MSPLEQKIIEKIKAEGPLSFEAFMSLALYDPEYGYYTRPSALIGRAGDFYTSPHLHRIFGAMIGRQMEEMWTIMGRPGRFQIVEMGAGMGYLARDMLDYLIKKELFTHIDYTIIELNPVVRERQKTLLDGYASRLRWVSDLADIGRVSGCVLSNELLDAFPVRVVVMGDTVEEVFVSVAGPRDTALVEIHKPCSSEAAAFLKEFSITLPGGYKTEINAGVKDWIMELSAKLERGFVLTIDYGYSTEEYYDEERSTGTLLCYFKHQLNENPYQHIGEQDITAHVNFSALKKWGEESGLKTEGYCPQGTYLVSLGIDETITEMYGDAPDPFEIAKIKGLIFPQGMGASHQVMVQSKGIEAAHLRGFDLKNRAGRL